MMKTVAIAGPFLKWAGGKTQLLDQIAPLYPDRIRHYMEPFVGSGAVFFDLRSRFPDMRATLSDNNEELINCYRIVRDDVEGLIRRLRNHKSRHGKEHYYKVRGESPSRLTPPQRAARFIYLNKTCYNGLYRVNASGGFNVPIGSYADPKICQASRLRAARDALQGVTLEVRDFGACLKEARKGTFVYIDPPYHPLSATSNFTGYTEGGFGEQEQIRLSRLFRDLHGKGARVMLSNSDTPFIRELYKGFPIHQVTARRAINSNGNRRGAITEVVVMSHAG
jgi:DNA adenine methylase